MVDLVIAALVSTKIDEADIGALAVRQFVLESWVGGDGHRRDEWSFRHLLAEVLQVVAHGLEPAATCLGI